MGLTTYRMQIAAIALFGAVATVGCGASAAKAPATPASTSEGDDATAGLMEHHRHHHHGGVTLFIAMSLDTLGVSPEQEATVERVRSSLHARMAPALAAEQSLMGVLADGVAAGSVDQPSADAHVAQVTAAAASAHDASSDALNELHGVLTPPQRAALVDKVEAHWAVWQKANADDGMPATAKDGHLATLAMELDLTPAQVDQIRAALRDRMKAAPQFDSQEVTSYLRAFGDAFRADVFDAHALAKARDGADARVAGRGAGLMASFVEAVNPVLTPEQRADFALRLREHATHNPSAQRNP
jgi:Spy/CpxP family protein refolding chaperone